MHEMSLALEICRITEQHAGTDRLGSVVAVAVDVGDDAGVEPASLEFCLTALLSTPPFGRARPILNHCDGDVLRISYLEIDDGHQDH